MPLTTKQITQRRLTQRNLTQQRTFETDFYRLFRPTMWGNAANVEKDGDNFVSQLNDLSGNSFNPVQATQANKPLLVENALNGQPVLRFDGSDDFMQVVFGEDFAQPNTFFVVWKVSASTTTQIAFASPDTSKQQALFWRTQTSKIAINGGTGVDAYSKNIPFDNILNSVVFNSSNSQVYENGDLKNTVNAGTNPTPGIILGNDTVGNWLQGDIAEIIFYNRLLTTFERTSVENYLMNKYGLPIT